MSLGPSMCYVDYFAYEVLAFLNRWKQRMHIGQSASAIGSHATFQVRSVCHLRVFGSSKGGNGRSLLSGESGT